MSLRFPVRSLVFVLLAALAPQFASAQQYTNIVNTRFRAVSSGPQSAYVLDVNNPNDYPAIDDQISREILPQVQAAGTVAERELQFLIRNHLAARGARIPLAATVLLRQNGKLLVPQMRRITRAPDPPNTNELTFTVPTTGAFSWPTSGPNNAQAIVNLVNLLYPAIKQIMGHPILGGNITIFNRDPYASQVQGIEGALLVIHADGTSEIWLPSFGDWQSRFLAVAQVLAQAFHGGASMAYDAWEKGMARAVALVAARNLRAQYENLPATAQPYGNDVPDADPGLALNLYYTPFYDLENEPALGNNTFSPASQSGQPVSNNLGGMLIPRMQMAAAAWLKCYIENPDFFVAFNNGLSPATAPGGYYLAYQQDVTVANDTVRLRALALAALSNGGGAATVEMTDFNTWFQQQYVLDTSITAGTKLYTYTTPATSTNPSGGTNSGAAVFTVYYLTTPTGDENNLSGTAQVVYWDNTFTNRLDFGQNYDSVQISDGFGSVAPVFSGLGQPPQLRLAMDFLIANSYVRVYYPVDEENGANGNPNDFAGTTVGADSGTVSVSYDGGSGAVPAAAVQGAFGAQGSSGAVPNGFSRTHIDFTPTGGTVVHFQRNTAFNNTYSIAPIWVLQTPAPATTLANSFAAGPAMISLPLLPYTHDMAAALGINPKAALLAQWDQSGPTAPSTDNYNRYPSLPLYQPGYGLWSNFATTINTSVFGESTAAQPVISVSLQYGWNQIGPPYNSSIDLSTQVDVEYLGQVATLANAITQGWVAAGVFSFTTAGGYQDITAAGQPNALAPWQGYWIRVMVPEGVILSYDNPQPLTPGNRRLGAPSRTPAAPTGITGVHNGWQLQMMLRDAQGHSASAVFGQSPRGSDAYISSLDAASPPPFTTGATLLAVFPHANWSAGYGSAGGNFVSDIRRLGSASQWNLTVQVPAAGDATTIAWTGTAKLPRGMRLTLTDLSTGAQVLMNSVAAYSFTAAPGELTRSFRVTAVPNSAPSVTILNAFATLPPFARGRAVSTADIHYELSAAAQTRVEIQSAGRVIRTLSSGRAASSGANSEVWDLRDNTGRGVPAGTYIVVITAQAASGEKTRVAVPLLVTR
ncbi:MAG: hypothetical protein KGJ62_14335 [Armatimonadetes bacterium]|nr:hypothetical protein [Armatimonadota bacterium]MDE2206657.1 hypothetical protein [Armatimonadota bacterium]